MKPMPARFRGRSLIEESWQRRVHSLYFVFPAQAGTRPFVYSNAASLAPACAEVTEINNKIMHLKMTELGGWYCGSKRQFSSRAHLPDLA
jgi:hypothetical protein